MKTGVSLKYFVNYCGFNGIFFILVGRLCIQTVYLATLDSVIYSASFVDNVTQVCLTPPADSTSAHLKDIPRGYFRLSRLPAQLPSIEAVRTI